MILRNCSEREKVCTCIHIYLYPPTRKTIHALIKPSHLCSSLFAVVYTSSGVDTCVTEKWVRGEEIAVKKEV